MATDADELNLFVAILNNAQNVNVTGGNRPGVPRLLYHVLVAPSFAITVKYAIALIHGKTVSIPRGAGSSPIVFVPSVLPGRAFISQATHDTLLETAETCGVENVCDWDLYLRELTRK